MRLWILALLICFGTASPLRAEKPGWQPLEVVDFFKDYDALAEVYYIGSSAERNLYRLEYRNNLFYFPNGKLAACHRANFVLGTDGHLYSTAAFDQNTKGFPGPGEVYFKHSSYFAGLEVMIAGSISIADGLIYSIQTNSGHYAPPPWVLHQFLIWLKMEGVNLGGVEYRYREDLHSFHPDDPDHILKFTPKELERLLKPGAFTCDLIQKRMN